MVLYGWRAYQTPEIIIEWSTASELDTVGYNLYRSQAEDQTGEKVNQNLIPAGGDPLSGSDYSFVDKQVNAGQRYYYWLEDVGPTGNTNRHGPIQVEAKREWGGLLAVALGVVMLGSVVYRPLRRLVHRQHASKIEPLEESSTHPLQ